MPLKNIAFFFLSLISVVFILIYAQNIIIPFVLGLLFWFIMRGTKNTLNTIPIVKKLPNWANSILAAGLIIGIFGLLFNIVIHNINALTLSYEKYQANLTIVVDQINQKYEVDVIALLEQYAKIINFGEILGGVFAALSNIMNNMFMIIVYALFILSEEVYFGTKLQRFFSNARQYERFSHILGTIEASIASYFKLKTLVSLLTAGLSYLALSLIGIDSPEFWAFLIFILNFIPTIGSLIATLFPATFALLQFGEVFPCLLVIGIVGFIQILVGNIVEPKVMGSSMNISPLVTIISLSLWGMIWGITGMILSVPITVVMIIVLSQFESTKGLAIILSEKGELD